jgi:hypothetical protein
MRSGFKISNRVQVQGGSGRPAAGILGIFRGLDGPGPTQKLRPRGRFETTSNIVAATHQYKLSVRCSVFGIQDVQDIKVRCWKIYEPSSPWTR